MPETDYGPAFDRLPSGEIIPLISAIEVIIEDRPDPERPDRGRTPITVRGARRYDGILKQFGEKSPEHDAAERFRDDCSWAAGARSGAIVDTRVAFDPSAYGPSEAVLDALTRAGDAWHAMGAARSSVVAWVILGNASLNSYAKAYQVRKTTGSRMLREALDALIGHYEECDGG